MYENWQNEAAGNLLALSEMLDNGECSFDEVPEIMLHNLYLVASCRYYKLDESTIKDTIYDKLCKYIFDNAEKFYEKVWWRDKLLDIDLLAAGSGYSLEYPRQIWEISYEMNRLAFQKELAA